MSPEVEKLVIAANAVLTDLTQNDDVSISALARLCIELNRIQGESLTSVRRFPSAMRTDWQRNIVQEIKANGVLV